ncbi:MAG: DUF885 domain-containing protein [Chloroflexi bacterium]|nr:DUF885 domain-containing protein [Chloroflexota bacterium]
MTVSDAFDLLAHDVFDTWYRYNPVEATWLGIHAYDDRLRDLSEDGIDRHAQAVRELLGRVQAFDTTGLPLEKVVDYQFIRALLRSILWSIGGVGDWNRNPMLYVQEPLFGLLGLLGRGEERAGLRLTNLIERLRATPNVLHACRDNVTTPPPVFVQTAIQAARAGAVFTRGLVERFLPDAGDAAYALASTGGDAIHAFERLADALEDDTPLGPEGSYAIGRELFEQRLSEWHLLNVSADQLAATGRRLFDETLQEIGELVERHAPGRDWMDVIADARQDHPTADGLLDAYRAELAMLRAFVQDRHLVTFPPDEALEVIDTPPFERATIPYAAYMPLAPFESASIGQFWVTPVDASATAEAQAAQLEEHCRASFPITALHEGYPGHHLQQAVASTTPSYTRKHAMSELFAEGWAFYCEQLMAEQGYYQDWRLRLFQLKGQLWRAARVIIDPGLHAGTMSFQDAVTLLVEGARLAPAQADGEVRRYCLTPTQPMSYAMGKEQILALRSELSELSLQQFHDRLLAGGTLQPALIRLEMLAGR